MSDLITDEHFTDGQSQINASNMNGIVSRAKVQPDVISSKPESATLNVSDFVLVLKTDNTLAKAKFSTFVNSTGSSLPLADATKNGMLKQVSGIATDFVGGDNQCHSINNIIPTGTVWDTLAATAPVGWLLLQGQAVLRTGVNAALFALIGTTYGVGDGSTTFNLPDDRGRTSIMAGTGTGLTARALGAIGGAETVVLATANLPAHAHPITDVAHSHTSPAHTHTDAGHTHTVANVAVNPSGVQTGGGTFYLPGSGNTGVGAANLTGTAVTISASLSGLTTTQNAGSGTGHANMQPFIVRNRMVKL